MRCDYVDLRLPTPDDPDACRKPDNKREVFQDGEFADFIAPLIKTLDLYHTDGVDPRAVAIAFQDLVEKHPLAQLDIISMEKRGKSKDKFLLRAETAKDANHSELSAEYFSNYKYLRTLHPEALEALIAEKDSYIRWLQGQISFAIKKPNIQAHSYHQQGDSMSEANQQNVTQNVGTNTGSMQAVAAGRDANVTQQTTQGASAEEITQQQAVELLAKIEELIKTANLPPEVVEEAVDYTKMAKKEAQKKEPRKQLVVGNLEGATSLLNNLSKTADAGKELITKLKPHIVKLAAWLGVAASIFLA